MMLFLIEYDRSNERLVSLCPFEDHELERANDARLELELALRRQGLTREIVILEAVDKDALRETHRRYFESYSSIARHGAASGALGAPIIGEPARIREGDDKK